MNISKSLCIYFSFSDVVFFPLFLSYFIKFAVLTIFFRTPPMKSFYSSILAVPDVAGGIVFSGYLSICLFPLSWMWYCRNTLRGFPQIWSKHLLWLKGELMRFLQSSRSLWLHKTCFSPQLKNSGTNYDKVSHKCLISHRIKWLSDDILSKGQRSIPLWQHSWQLAQHFSDSVT